MEIRWAGAQLISNSHTAPDPRELKIVTRGDFEFAIDDKASTNSKLYRLKQEAKLPVG